MPTVYTLPLLLAMMLASGHALAQQIHAGSATGSYTNDFCPQVEEALKAQYFEHRCTTSEGSADNVTRVLANPADAALGQFDVVAAAADDKPGTLAMVNPGIGLECLYAVTSEAGIDSLRGLSPRMPVALPSARSGSAATFKYLQSLDEGLAQMRNITHHDSALDAVQAVVDGNAALAFFVQFPNTKNQVFQTINEAGLNFVPVINRQILRREVAGQQVYQPQEVVVTPAGLLGSLMGQEPEKIVTTCMPVVLFTGDPSQLPEGSVERQDQLDLIKQLAATQPPSGGDWRDVLSNAVAISREKAQEFIDQF
jgi:hypothetical protein